MELTAWKPQLREILVQDGDRATAIVTIPTIQAMWPRLQEVGDAADVCKAALVYSLSETTVEDEGGIPRAKWELTRVASNPLFDPEQDDPDEELMPYSATWQEFCLVHLGMHKSTASKYKRVWEVYHEVLGYGLDDLLVAGTFKLGSAVGTLSKMLKAGEGIDQRLIVALFGNEHACSLCNGHVSFLAGETPAICPLCGEDYRGVQPWSGPRTILLLKQLRGRGEEKESGKLDVFASLEHGFDEDGEVVVISLLAECGLEEGARSSLPSWELNVIADDEPAGTLGVRESHLKALENWFRRKFPGA